MNAVLRNLLLAAMAVMPFVVRADVDEPEGEFLPQVAVAVLAVIGAVIIGSVAWCVRRGARKAERKDNSAT